MGDTTLVESLYIYIIGEPIQYTYTRALVGTVLTHFQLNYLQLKFLLRAQLISLIVDQSSSSSCMKDSTLVGR